MNNISPRTKSLITAAACALGLAVGAASARPQAALQAEPESMQAELTDSVELPQEHVIVTEPVYVIVAKKPGAPMATGDLPVQVVNFSEPTRVQVYRTPNQAVARISPYASVE